MSKKNKCPLSPCTDTGNAELIAALFKDLLRFDHSRGRWLIWDKRCCRWREDKTDEVYRFAIDAARSRKKAAANLTDKEESKKEFGWALASEDRHRLDAALRIAKSLPPIAEPGTGWDADPWLFGVANGILNLRTGTLRPMTQEDRITKFSPIRFDPSERCPRFERFVTEVFLGDTDMTDYLQKAGGYSLTGSVREQCMFVAYGSGRNGKTTLLEILLHVLGDYGEDLSVSVLEVKRNGNMAGEAVNLPGARFVKSVEIREGRRLDEARIKALTGGDTISVRPLYRNSFSFQPTHKLWLAVNHKPVITDSSPAMWRRIRLFPFTRAFDGMQDDKELPEKLKAEASGILNWLIQGCLAWQREGLRTPAKVEEATREYERESDSIGPFLEDCCIVDSAESVTSADLWGAYQDWAKRTGAVPLSRSAIADRLKRRGHKSEESGHDKRRVWRGLALAVKCADAGLRAGAGIGSQDF